MSVMRARPRRRGLAVTALIALIGAGLAGDGSQAQTRSPKGPSMLAPAGPSLMMPRLDPARGRKLFAARGCVICHAVNGIGGTLGPNLDASRVGPYANLFDFAARMWRGADAMITLQEAEIGYQIDIDSEALADLTAFAHDLEEQSKFSESDIPPAVLRMMRMRRL